MLSQSSSILLKSRILRSFCVSRVLPILCFVRSTSEPSARSLEPSDRILEPSSRSILHNSTISHLEVDHFTALRIN
ncbi:hypothetical protein Tco_0386711 [Tanacetum coccineum]